jgi:predicted DNA-binding transcriptional regulator YafY
MPVGRDQLKPMQRLVRIMAVLDQAGPAGAQADRLIEIAGYGEADPKTQLGKDLNHLRNQGWQIDNVAGPGEDARYRMVAGDNRLRLKLTPEQLAALQRAVILADRADLAARLGVKAGALPQGLGSAVLPHEQSAELNLALQSLRLRSRIRFRYKGTPREVNPGAVRFQHVQWYLSGVEVGDDVVKHFAVSRMSEVSLAEPGTAETLEEIRRIRLHPLEWQVDQPTEVTLRTARDFVPDVVRWLREPERTAETEDAVDLTYVVTNRTAFRARVYVLGTRVEVVGPDDFRAELLTELRELVGA